MIYSSLPPSTTNLNLDANHPPNTKRFRPLSFWASLSSKSKSLSRKQSTVSLSSTSSPSLTQPTPSLGGSRVVAIVGNIRFGIGRLMVEELVRNKLIVVALTDRHDSSFSQPLQALAPSPSLFHAFPIPPLFSPGFFPQSWRPNSNSLQLDSPTAVSPPSTTTASPSPSPRPRSFKSLKPLRIKNGNSSPTLPTLETHDVDVLGDQARLLTITEITNVLRSYRVDTVICCFEPITRATGPRATARRKDEDQIVVPAQIERTRIEAMESTVLRACVNAGSVRRFAVCAHGPSPFDSSPLTPPPTCSPPSHLRVPSSALMTLTEFRWAFLMNDLAADEALVDGLTAENGLGKWLCEPPKGPSGKWMIDFENKTVTLPLTRHASGLESKGKERVEPVCFTLAEDVARFVALACKLKSGWTWCTGSMVGDKIKGGWEEVFDMLESVSRTSYRREYHQKFGTVGDASRDSQSTAATTTSSKSSLDQYHPLQPTEPPLPQTSTLSPFHFTDTLRASLARERFDASSVRLAEFFRVWFAPLPKPPTIVVDRRSNHRQSLQSHQTRRQNLGLLGPPSHSLHSSLPTKLSAASLLGSHHPKNPSNTNLAVPSPPTNSLSPPASSSSAPTVPSALSASVTVSPPSPALVLVQRDSYNLVPSVVPLPIPLNEVSGHNVHHVPNHSGNHHHHFTNVGGRNQPVTSSPLAQKVS